MTNQNFILLIIGLARFLQQEPRRYPYPPELQYSLNVLALEKLAGHPKTLTGLLHQLEQPLASWWAGALPPTFPPDAPLVENGELSFAALEYLEALTESEQIPVWAGITEIEVVVDNQAFRNVLERLRTAARTDPTGAQQEYVKLRNFLIRHPFVRLTEIGQEFSETHHVSADEVANLYVAANPLIDVMGYPNDNGQRVFWQCEQCGPLYLKSGYPASIKQTVCGQHCPRYRNGWRAIEASRQLRVLRKGIHLRVHLPGIAEVKLLQWLEAQRQTYPELLKEVIPWPRIDTYDIQLRFIDSTWGVDLKDYADPNSLGRNLTGIYREGHLHWDRGFYVYPEYRNRQRLDYREAVQGEARARLKDIEILSDQQFMTQVEQKLKLLRKGKINV